MIVRKEARLFLKKLISNLKNKPIIVQGPRNIFFFLETVLKKKLLNIFSNFFVLFESTILPVNNGK